MIQSRVIELPSSIPERYGKLYFTSCIPQAQDVVRQINTALGFVIVDKDFYGGNGMYEVASRDTILSNHQVIHVFSDSPSRKRYCINAPSWFLCQKINDIAYFLGKVVFPPLWKELVEVLHYLEHGLGPPQHPPSKWGSLSRACYHCANLFV